MNNDATNMGTESDKGGKELSCHIVHTRFTSNEENNSLFRNRGTAHDEVSMQHQPLPTTQNSSLTPHIIEGGRTLSRIP